MHTTVKRQSAQNSQTLTVAPGRKKSQRQATVNSTQAIRRIHLFTHGGGLVSFRIRGAGSLPAVESRVFPKKDARGTTGTAPTVQLFREFLAELKRQGWWEHSKGERWYERDMARKL
jgi:hypothetical protein